MQHSPNPCRNMNHGRSGVTINFCPECGQKFQGIKAMSCGSEKHMAYRKRRLAFCIDCGGNLKTDSARGANGKR
jgi:hypothetical protein